MGVSQAVVVHKVEHLNSKDACSSAVLEAHHSASAELVVLSANMRHVSQRQISMLRQMIDNLSDSPSSIRTKPSKHWVLLLHFMPGAALKAC